MLTGLNYLRKNNYVFDPFLGESLLRKKDEQKENNSIYFCTEFKHSELGYSFNILFAV
jgi:hypothetical protein